MEDSLLARPLSIECRLLAVETCPPVLRMSVHRRRPESPDTVKPTRLDRELADANKSYPHAAFARKQRSASLNSPPSILKGSLGSQVGMLDIGCMLLYAASLY